MASTYQDAWSAMLRAVPLSKPRWPVDLPLYRRVVIRRRIDDPASGYRFSDVKGTIYHIDDTSLLLQPEGQDAYLVIELDDIEAAKPIPPRPARRNATFDNGD